MSALFSMESRYNRPKCFWRTKPATRSTGMRLEVTMQPNWSAGIQEWKLK